jgi:hypothetical protein
VPRGVRGVSIPCRPVTLNLEKNGKSRAFPGINKTHFLHDVNFSYTIDNTVKRFQIDYITFIISFLLYVTNTIVIVVRPIYHLFLELSSAMRKHFGFLTVFTFHEFVLCIYVLL